MEQLDWLMYEKQAQLKGYKAICGVDEAGRGPLAGPVCAAAVILPENTVIEGVNDSKKLTEKKRYNISECWLSSGVLSGPGHVPHLFHDLLTGYEGVHLIKQGHGALRDKVCGVPQILADRWLCDRNNRNPHAGKFVPERKPRSHFAEHSRLIVDHHSISKAHSKLFHHGFVLRPGVLHSGNRFVGKYSKDRHTVLIAPFCAFAHLDFDAVWVLVICGISGTYKSAVYTIHKIPP